MLKSSLNSQYSHQLLEILGFQIFKYRRSICNGIEKLANGTSCKWKRCTTSHTIYLPWPPPSAGTSCPSAVDATIPRIDFCGFCPDRWSQKGSSHPESWGTPLEVVITKLSVTLLCGLFLTFKTKDKCYQSRKSMSRPWTKFQVTRRQTDWLNAPQISQDLLN